MTSATVPAADLLTVPPMGWNSWHAFGCAVDEAGIRQIADALVDTGLREAGYTYVIVDDGWFHPERAEDGTLRPHPDRFPSGMPALADHLHARGLRLGLYQTPTDRTCAQRAGAYPGSTGSKGHERRDAQTFAAWGVDYLKYDWCCPNGTLAEQQAAFALMRDELAATGRPIVYSINPTSRRTDNTSASADWSDVANLWRTTDNLVATWSTGNQDRQPLGVLEVLDTTAPLSERAAPGRFNDPDMLQVGVPTPEGHPELSLPQVRAHFGMWALLAAPLVLGADLRTLPQPLRAVLAHPAIIAVNQDPLARPARRVRHEDAHDVWVKPLVDDTMVVGLLNRTDRAQRITADRARLGLLDDGTPLAGHDLWTGQRRPIAASLTQELGAHELGLFHVTVADDLA
jgi:alpha-galactosidase